MSEPASVTIGGAWVLDLSISLASPAAMAHMPEPEPHKRKRDSDDSGGQSSVPDRIPQPPPPQSGTGTPINYLSKANPARLKLIQGDPEVFSDVLTLISDYEGVLSRHESLAANLGAKLTGPRLVKAMEGVFEGPIVTSPRDPFTPCPVAWLDIVQFAKASPSDFTLTSTSDRGRVCQFDLKGVGVEITEDDWRLIMSGALDRFRLAPPHPLEEDENAELATLEILEQRLQVLIKKADEVARKARQLNYHLSGRKAAINSRRSTPQSQGPGFQAVNQPQQQRGPGPTPGYDLRADLLQQFLAHSSHPGSSRVAGSASIPTTPVIQQAPGTTRPPSQQVLMQSSRPSPSAYPESSQRSEPSAEDPTAAHRPLITARIEKLSRGETIHPPCDRCRRLRVACIKHLTACQGCTKKHAKCGWRSVTDEEIAWLKGEMGPLSEGEGGGDGDGGSARGYTPDTGQSDPRGLGDYGSSSRTPETRHEGRFPALRDPAASARRDLEMLSRAGTGPGGELEAMELDYDTRGQQRGKEVEGSSSSRGGARGGHPFPREALRLSRVASAATAAAEARGPRVAVSRGSSAGQE